MKPRDATFAHCVMLMVLLGVTLPTSGCAWTNDTVPRAPIEFARSDYKLGEETTGQACRGYAFGIAWSALFGRDTTSSGSRGVLGLLAGERVTPEAEEALFIALERSDEATHLIAPRVSNSFNGFGTVGLPLFGKRCGQVWARTAAIGGPIDRVSHKPAACPPPPTVAPPAGQEPQNPTEKGDQPSSDADEAEERDVQDSDETTPPADIWK